MNSALMLFGVLVTENLMLNPPRLVWLALIWPYFAGIRP